MRFIRLLIRLFSTALSSIQTHQCLFGKVQVNFPSKLSKNCVFKDNVNFNGIKVLGDGKVYFGNNFHSGKNVKIITTYHNYDKGKKIPYDSTYITRDVVIEDNVWIGDNVIILNGIVIQEGAIIQAGSVVVSDVEYCSIVGGAPAKKFKSRDIEHYENLKSKSEFF